MPGVDHSLRAAQDQSRDPRAEDDKRLSEALDVAVHVPRERDRTVEAERAQAQEGAAHGANRRLVGVGCATVAADSGELRLTDPQVHRFGCGVRAH